MTHQCQSCRHFKKGKPHTCNLTRHSCLWERAMKLSTMKTPAGNGQHWTEVKPVRDNCSYEARFFEARS